jgi:hypothetical protein
MHYGSWPSKLPPFFYRARPEFSYNRTESDAPSGIDRLALESDSTTIKPFGGER